MSSYYPQQGSAAAAAAAAALRRPTQGAKGGAIRGPWLVKFLVPDRLAGVIIGKGGSGIAQLEEDTGASMRLSGARVFFPGTSERVMVCGGEESAIESLLPILLQKLNDFGSAPPAAGSVLFRFVLTNSACSCIIGKGGEVIKTLSSQTGASIRASDRVDNPSHHERVVEVKGTEKSVLAACLEIISRVQEDAAFREFASVLNYGVDTAAAPNSAYYYPGNLAAAAGAAGAQAAALRSPAGVVVDQYPITIEFSVPSSAVGAIIGKSGEARNRIVHSTGANLVVSDRNQDPLAERKISISGPLAAVQAALTLVAKLIVDSQ